MLEWIAKRMPHRVIEQSAFADFLIRTDEDRVDGIEVRYVKSLSGIAEVTSNERYDRHTESLRDMGVTSLTVIFVARNEKITAALVETLQGSDFTFGFIVGSVQPTLDGECFIPFYSNQLIPAELSER